MDSQSYYKAKNFQGMVGVQGMTLDPFDVVREITCSVSILFSTSHLGS